MNALFYFENVRGAFNDEAIVERYVDDIRSVGLWESEKVICEKYFDKSSPILDLGCGAGRTTFGLHDIGYSNIVALDLADRPIAFAKNIATQMGIGVKFLVANVLEMRFPNESFHGAIFSFNGLWNIPLFQNRVQALKEVSRTLKTGSYFIFTAYEGRGILEKYRAFWESYDITWNSTEKDSRLLEHGDVFLKLENEPEIYIHFPTNKEIMQMIADSGFELTETALRSEIANEPLVVTANSDDCRFWIVRKKAI